MTDNLGKNINGSGNGTAQPLGACTITCPAACKSIATVYCKCKDQKYANRGSSYQTDYNSVVHSYRTPDFG